MCTNRVSYWIPRGHSHKEYFVRCGNTDPYGGRAICDTCAADPKRMREIERQEQNVRADNDWSNSAGWGDW